MQLLKLSAFTESQLREKARDHNSTGSVRKITVEHLKAVYRRGAQVYSAQTRYAGLNEFALLRVDAYLDLLSHDNPAKTSYTQDFDLLPQSHPLIASGATERVTPRSALAVQLIPEAETSSPEHALFNLAEISEMGYEVIPALRAAWNRGTTDHEFGTPYERALRLATDPTTSPDNDLLPTR